MYKKVDRFFEGVFGGERLESPRSVWGILVEQFLADTLRFFLRTLVANVTYLCAFETSGSHIFCRLVQEPCSAQRRIDGGGGARLEGRHSGIL